MELTEIFVFGPPIIFSNGCALLADDPADEVVVSEDLEADLLLLPDVLGLLLHDLEGIALAGGAAVLGLAVHGDGLLQLPELTAGRRLHFSCGHLPWLCFLLRVIFLIVAPRRFRGAHLSLQTRIRRGEVDPTPGSASRLAPITTLLITPPAIPFTVHL